MVSADLSLILPIFSLRLGSVRSAVSPARCDGADNGAPAVEITRATGQASLTKNPIAKFVATFSKPVLSFTSSKVTLTAGTTGASSVTVNAHTSTIYNISVNGISASGTVSVSIAANAVKDGTGNNNTASIDTANFVIVGGCWCWLPPCSCAPIWFSFF